MTENISRIIEQDIKAAHSAFSNDDFRLMNIYANRVMSNAILSDDPRLTLPGFFLKEAARIYGSIKAKKDLSTFSTAKSLGEVYLNGLKLDSSFGEMWQRYHDFFVRVLEHDTDEHEKKSYKADPEFTNFAFRFFIEKMSEDRDILYNVNNQFLRGLLNEMDRIFRVHKGGLFELYALSLVRALELYSGYVPYYEKRRRNEIIGKSLLPYIEAISEMLREDPVDPEKVALLLKRIILDWRLCFIHFMEAPGYIPVQEEKRVPITEETKKRISETVSKALEEEVR